MVFQVREFDDLPEGWMVEKQDPSHVLFRNKAHDVSVRLHQDEDYDFWVVMQHRRRPADQLFQQRFPSAGDAIRTGTSVMSLYNTLLDQTVSEVMKNVSIALTLMQTFQEDEDREEMDGTEEVIAKIDTSLQEGDYEQIEQIADTAVTVALDQLDLEEWAE